MEIKHYVVCRYLVWDSNILISFKANSIVPITEPDSIGSEQYLSQTLKLLPTLPQSICLYCGEHERDIGQRSLSCGVSRI